MLSATTASGAACGFWATAREETARSSAPPIPISRPARSSTVLITHPAAATGPPRSRRPLTSRVRAGQRAEDQLVAFGRQVDLQLFSPAQVARQHPLAQRILDVLLDRALERASPVILVVAFGNQEIGRGGGELDLVSDSSP